MSTVFTLLKRAALLDFAIQGAGFVVSVALKSEKLYDLAGSGTFLLLAYKSLQWGGATQNRQVIQSGCVSVWAVRLGLYLFSRILKDGSDRRFNKIRSDPKKFFVAWSLQGVWVLLVMLPTIIQNAKKRTVPIGLREYVGWGIWLTGFLLQATADYQKSAFRADPANAGKFISAGLWNISRHPNYFGEIMMWSGLYLAASRSLIGWEHLSVISPVFTAFLLTQVSGVPMLEKSGMRRWGDDPEYQRYLSEVPVLIPSLARIFRS